MSCLTTKPKPVFPRRHPVEGELVKQDIKNTHWTRGSHSNWVFSYPAGQQNPTLWMISPVLFGGVSPVGLKCLVEQQNPTVKFKPLMMGELVQQGMKYSVKQRNSNTSRGLVARLRELV